MSIGSGRRFNWRTAIFVILALFVGLMIVGKVINSITYPVVPAEAFFPPEAKALFGATLSDTDQGLLALMRDLRAVQEAKEGRGARARNFLSSLSGAMNIEQSLPIVHTVGFWFENDDDENGSFLSARSMSHSVIFGRWSFGCQPPPEGFQKEEYMGEKMLTRTTDGETAALTLSDNNFIIGNDQDVVKRVVDKLKSGEVGLDVPGELGTAYSQYSDIYPFVVAVKNEGRELVTFIERLVAPMFSESQQIEDMAAFIENIAEHKLHEIEMVAGGCEVASAERFEATGFLVCSDAGVAKTLAEVMNRKLQKPAEDGKWSATVVAKAEGNRITFDLEIGGLKELLLAQMEKAEKAAEAAMEVAAQAEGERATSEKADPDTSEAPSDSAETTDQGSQ